MIGGHHPLGDPGDLAALYAAGAMNPEAVAAFEAHLADGCPICTAELRALDGVIAKLAEGIGAQAPPPRVRDALIEYVTQAAVPPGSQHAAEPQVWRQWSADAHDQGLFIKRAGEGAWEETGVTGVRVRRLFVDQPRNEMTILVRMDAGSSYPSHVHDGPEQCLVLQGNLHVGETVLQAGDYQRAAGGSRHDIQRTDSGCLLLITSSLSDEIE